MTPIEAVQSAVTQAMQTAQNNNKNTPLNFKDAEKYSGDDGSMRFMWIKKTTDSENVLSFNEVLKAGVAIFDSGLDSLERANLSYGYKVAMGYAKLLSNKLDYSKKLVGQVKQEISLPKSFIKKNLEKIISSKASKDNFLEIPVISKITKTSNGTPNTKKSHQKIPNDVSILNITSPIENITTPVPTSASGKTLCLSFMLILMPNCKLLQLLKRFLYSGLTFLSVSSACFIA